MRWLDGITDSMDLSLPLLIATGEAIPLRGRTNKQQIALGGFSLFPGSSRRAAVVRLNWAQVFRFFTPRGSNNPYLATLCTDISYLALFPTLVHPWRCRLILQR